MPFSKNFFYHVYQKFYPYTNLNQTRSDYERREERKKKLDTHETLKRADKVLGEPISTTKPEIYYIAYIVESPTGELIYHCEYVSINISRLSEPGDKKNLAKAIREFKLVKIPILKERHKESKNITPIPAYLSSEECQKFIDEENCKQEKIKQLKRIQNL